jgi:hypothetical protein
MTKSTVAKVKETAGSISKLLIRGAESRILRAFWWVIVAIAIAGFLSSALAGILEPVLPNYSQFFWTSWFLLSITISSSNVFIVFRSTRPLQEPLFDLKYHAQICEKSGLEESKFLNNYHRLGRPYSIGFNLETTLDYIERAIPSSVLFYVTGFVSLSVGALGLLSIIGFDFWELNYDFNNLLGSLFISGGGVALLWFAIIEGLHKPWSFHQNQKSFWTIYWSHALNLADPTQGTIIAEEVGHWHLIIKPYYWEAKDADFSNDDFLKYVREKLKKKIKEFKLTDTIADDTTIDEITSYGDKLALLSEIRNELKDNKNELDILSEKSERFRNLRSSLASINSLADKSMLANLKSYWSELNIMPIASESLESLEEMELIRNMDDTEKEKIRKIAEIRLDYYRSQSDYPLPGSLKWMGLFYTIASLLSSAVSLIFSR